MSSSDFEVHPVGTAEALRLAASLCASIAQLDEQFARVIPVGVLRSCAPLREKLMELKPELALPPLDTDRLA